MRMKINTMILETSLAMSGKLEYIYPRTINFNSKCRHNRNANYMLNKPQV